MSGLGSYLAQLRPANTNAAALLTVAAAQRQGVEITRIVICNITAGALTFRLFHDDDGTTYDGTTALYYDAALPANDTVVINAASGNAGFTISPGGTLACRASAADSIVFTVYGVPKGGR